MEVFPATATRRIMITMMKEEGGSGSKHRRVSLLDQSMSLLDQISTSSPSSIPATPVRNSTDDRSENQDPTVIQYPEGLPSILFHGDSLLSDDEDKVVKARIQLKGILRSKNAIENTRQFVALGGHAILVTVMKKWETHQVIQYRLVASFADFTYHYNNAQNDLNIFSALVQIGGMDLVVGAMSRFATIEAFQYICMLSVGNLCTDVGRIECKQDRAKHFVNQLQGVNLICDAMKRFVQNEMIQQTGTWLFEVLCGARHERGSAGKCGHCRSGFSR